MSKRHCNILHPTGKARFLIAPERTDSKGVGMAMKVANRCEMSMSTVRAGGLARQLLSLFPRPTWQLLYGGPCHDTLATWHPRRRLPEDGLVGLREGGQMIYTSWVSLGIGGGLLYGVARATPRGDEEEFPGGMAGSGYGLARQLGTKWNSFK